MFLADLLVPGSYRAEELISPLAFAQALFDTEKAWVRALARVNHIDTQLAEKICDAMGEPNEELIGSLSISSESGGNPVIDLVKVLRARVEKSIDDSASHIVHTGMTSQDVMDTALMLCLKQTMISVSENTRGAGNQLAMLVEAHAETPMMGRTLAQQALPTTFGARAAGWLLGLADALERLDNEVDQLQVSLAGAVGNMATACAWAPENEDAADWVAELSESFSDELDLAYDSAGVWHTRRGPVQSAAVVLADVSLAFGKVANDVIESARNEVAELTEPVANGRGGSSAMAHKRNPVLSILIRRSAVASAQALGNLYESAALSHEERSAGAWHLEWEPLERLMTHAVVCAQLAKELLSGLEVNVEAMKANLNLLADDPVDVETLKIGTSARLSFSAVEQWQKVQEFISENHQEEETE